MAVTTTLWKYQAGFQSIGLAATIGAGSYFTPKTGSEVQHTYLFDDSSLMILMLIGSGFSALTSYFYYLQSKDADEKSEPVTVPLMVGAIIGAGCLGTASLYAFDVAFFGGAIFGNDRPHAGPETGTETIVFSMIYSFIGLASLMLAYTQGKAFKEESQPDDASHHKPPSPGKK